MVMNHLLGTIRREITQAAARLGISGHRVNELARSVEESVCREHGGSEIYIPSQDRCHRNERIREDFTGANQDELCQRYRISRRTLTRILNGQAGEET